MKIDGVCPKCGHNNWIEGEAKNLPPLNEYDEAFMCQDCKAEGVTSLLFRNTKTGKTRYF
jgi:hypothetical protein